MPGPSWMHVIRTRGFNRLAIVLCLGVLGSPQITTGQAREDWRAYPSAEWPLAGGHWGHTRHSTLTQINTETVADLGGAWVTELDGEVSRSTAVVTDGLMFSRDVDGRPRPRRQDRGGPLAPPGARGSHEQGGGDRCRAGVRRSERRHADRAGPADRGIGLEPSGSVMMGSPGR